MQKKFRFVADERYDLPHHDKMLELIDAEFYAFNEFFLTPNNKVVRGWEIINNGGLQVKVKQTEDSLLFNTERDGFETQILWKTTDDALALNLADNAVNYVEVQIVSTTCAPDTVAIWDTTANGGQGEEFTQTVDTITEQHPNLVSNTIAFTGDPDKLPLAIVTTLGGAIVSIVDARDFFFSLVTDWDFGVVRTDETIFSLKDAFDAITTSIKELKGTTAWYDKPFASNKLLKEYQNMFLSGGGDIEWEGSQGANTLGWSAPIVIEIADRANTYTIPAGTVSLLDGDAMYVDIPAGASPPLVPQVAQLSAVPIDPASPGFSAGIQVLFFRRGSTVYGIMDIPELDSGEVANIGLDLPTTIRDRLGIVSESAYQPYTSTLIISSSDTYPEAISKLDLAVNTALSDTAIEETITATAGQTVVNFSIISFDPSTASVDLKAYRDGVKMEPNDDYAKTGPAQITMNYPLILGEKICGRMEKSAVPALGPQAYFVNYYEGLIGTAIATGNAYNTGTDKLSVYRNGLYMVNSASGSFPATDRYLEASSSSILLAFGVTPVDWLAFVNEDTIPAARTQSIGLTGTVLTVPTYTMGNDSLRVYRNGVLMNTAGLGAAADQYTETSTTSITLALASNVSDVWTFYVMGVAPTFRQDVDGLTGTVLTLPAPITVGNERLLVFKNGVLMLNSLTMATANERYQETSTTQITLAAAAIATDVFTYIYY